MKFVPIILALFIIGGACNRKKTEAPSPFDESERYSGGNSTSFIFGEQAFNQSMGNLSLEQRDRFKFGNSDFRMVWVAAGNSTTSRDGLGPLFNATNCSACHANDGRGKPDMLNGLLFRLSIPGNGAHGSPLDDENYGGQIANFGIFGATAEATVSINYTEIKGMFEDGEEYVLQKPEYSFTDLAYGPLTSNILVSPRVGPQVYGLGLLEAIPEATILKHTDEFDLDHDEISGKANYVWDVSLQKESIGRFGWKANQPTLRQQVAGALSGDMGLTTNIFPTQNLSASQAIKYASMPTGGNPEVPDSLLEELVFYQKLLAVPGRRDIDKPEVISGKKIFLDLQCNKCHIPQLETGYNEYAALSNQKIYPYTDLLLHDMGIELADNRPDYLANGLEWRTPPLWGIGLIKTVNKHTYFLHDGRARDLKEAILWHNGEGKTSKDKFLKLTKGQRNDLLRFLESL